MDHFDKNSERYLAAKKRVKEIKAFYIHATVYVFVNLFIMVQNLRKGVHWTDPNNYWIAFFWGIGLLAHAISVFMPRFFLGKDWEERKIKELMEKYRKQN